ncbi:hypothetical protein C8J57DRAFT_615212 [Mycena rebaudengoi]|nr:hypothetical protein C8J57DRAFT_615212 [Mycena rebaudengoi]
MGVLFLNLSTSFILSFALCVAICFLFMRIVCSSVRFDVSMSACVAPITHLFQWSLSLHVPRCIFLPLLFPPPTTSHSLATPSCRFSLLRPKTLFCSAPRTSTSARARMPIFLPRSPGLVRRPLSTHYALSHRYVDINYACSASLTSYQPAHFTTRSLLFVGSPNRCTSRTDLRPWLISLVSKVVPRLPDATNRRGGATTTSLVASRCARRLHPRPMTRCRKNTVGVDAHAPKFPAPPTSAEAAHFLESVAVAHVGARFGYSAGRAICSTAVPHS